MASRGSTERSALWTRERLAALFAHEIPLAEQLLPNNGDENLRLHSFPLPLAAIRIHHSEESLEGSPLDEESSCETAEQRCGDHEGFHRSNPFSILSTAIHMPSAGDPELVAEDGLLRRPVEATRGSGAYAADAGEREVKRHYTHFLGNSAFE